MESMSTICSLYALATWFDIGSCKGDKTTFNNIDSSMNVTWWWPMCLQVCIDIPTKTICGYNFLEFSQAKITAQRLTFYILRICHKPTSRCVGIMDNKWKNYQSLNKKFHRFRVIFSTNSPRYFVVDKLCACGCEIKTWILFFFEIQILTSNLNGHTI